MSSVKERSVERRLRKSVLRIEGIASFGNERYERALNYLLRFVVVRRECGICERRLKKEKVYTKLRKV